MVTSNVAGYKLSPQQKRLWLLQQEAHDATYRAQCVLRVRGELRPQLLKEALRSVVRRHEILRTTFQRVPGLDLPVQVVADSHLVSIPEYDLSGWGRDEQLAKVNTIMGEDGRVPLESEVERPLSASLVKTSASEHLLLLSLPAMCADTATLRNLARELGDACEALAAGREPSEESLQYVVVSEWLNELLEAEETEAGRYYWRKKALFDPLDLRLPFETQPASKAGFAASSVSRTLDPVLLSRIEAVAGSRETSTSAFFHACWQILLSRLTGRAEVVTGCAFDGRTDEELENALGLFARYLPLQSHVGAGDAFGELLKRVDDATREVAKWQECFSWEHVARAVDKPPAEAPSAVTPFFPFCFEFEAEPSRRFALGLSFEFERLYACIDRFKVKLSCVERGDSVLIKLHYDAALLNADNIERLAEEFITLLASAAAEPDAPVSGLEVVGQRECQRLLVEFNRTRVEYPAGLCLHQLFESQVERTPDATALVFEEESLTYRELNQRANRLAHHLRSLGVGADTPVGILLERSVEMVVSLLATLKAGAAYVPLDPDYPQERLSFMLEDARAPVLLTLEKHASELGAGVGCEVVLVDAESESFAGRSIENPERVTTSENLAYVIYTSGSTGRPKGVMITHGAICNHMLWMRETFPLKQSDAVLQKTPFSFDASVWEFYAPLLAGARLVVARPGGHRDTTYLARTIDEHKVTTLQLVPSLLRMLVDHEPEFEKCTTLRRVFCGGEALSAELAKRFEKRLGADLFNLYGPTETTIDATFWEYERDHPHAVIPIGRPVANTQAYILDERLRPVPLGATGELHIGGDGLARGYLYRPELTAEKFIPNPFSSEQGARLYKTGDSARYLPNGQIEFVGRADHQLKVRGFRIELGEIESALEQDSNVRQALVMAREDHAGETRLVAYVVAREGQALSTESLRAIAERKLPAHMIPSAFVTLDALPLLPNGKVDRDALPEPAAATDSVEYVAPRTEVEREVAAVWTEVLGVERVGIDDNFFSLGGDSIRSVQLLSRLRERGLTFSLPDLFRHQSIRELSEQLERVEDGEREEREEEEAFSLITEEERRLLPGDVEEAYPLTQLQAGMLFHSELNPHSSIYYDVTSFHLRAQLNEERLKEAVQEVASRHAVLRTSFELSGYSRPLQLVHRSVEVPVVIEDLRGLEGEEQERAVEAGFEAEKGTPFEWGRAPLFRVRVQRRSDDSFQFTLTSHHSILDGWSTASLLTELFGLYISPHVGEVANVVAGVFGDDGSVEISEDSFGSSVGYFSSDNSEWGFRTHVREELQSLSDPSHSDYWRHELAGASLTSLPPFSDLAAATDSTRGQASHPLAVATPTVRRYVVPISREVSDGLHALARQAEVPLKSVLLAAHLRSISVACGSSEVMSGVVTHGRGGGRGAERVLGLFLNTMPVRARMKGGSWTGLAREAFELEARAYAHRHYPLAGVMKEVWGGGELFEVAFNYVHFHVYDALRAMGQLELLDARGFDATNIPLLAEFSKDSFSTQIYLTLISDSTRLSDEQLESIGGYYGRALASMATEPHQRYETQSLLSEEEERKLLETSQGVRVEYRGLDWIHQTFERQAALTPQATALVFESERMTYRELNERANRLAHYLISLGAGAESRVGVMLERSFEMVVSLLATLKAGAAYVPLDPSYPHERLSFMFSDCGLRLLLTDSELAARLHVEPDVRLVSLDECEALLSAQSDANPCVPLDGDNLAYCIYTSGSTGRPKGAMNTHRAIANRLRWMQETYRLGTDDSVLQKTPFGFDVSVWEFFWPLGVGATLVVARPGGHREVEYLAGLIEHEGVSVVHFVPSMLRLFLDGLGAGRCRSLRLVVSSGEALSEELAERCLRLLPGARLDNLYGPTEAAVDVSWWRCGELRERDEGRDRERDEGRSAGGVVPIGVPIANLELYVLDGEGRLAVCGAAGELYIGGEGLGRGYVGRPDLTAERFVPHAFGHSEGERLYRTGDLARWGKGGRLEYLGRIDQQVKVHGYRIELGEIEATLRQHPAIEEAVVVTSRGAQDFDVRLVGYIVPCRPAAAAENGASGMPEAQALAELLRDVRGYLQERLPIYMVPHALVTLAEMPLSPNGKIDRRALPPPDEASQPTVRREYAPPCNETEEILASIWSQALGVERVGVQDNFFELGGDSILSIQIVARANRAGLHFTHQQLFQHPTVAGLAAVCGTAEPSEAEQAVVTGPVPLTPIQQWFFEHELPRPQHWNQTLLLEVEPGVDATILERVWRTLLAHHDALRLRFTRGEEGWRQHNAGVDDDDSFSRVSLSGMNDSEQRAAIESAAEAAQSSLELSEGPLSRCVLFDSGDERPSRLLVVIHHLVIDGVSWRILLEDLQRAYEQAASGHEIEFGPKTTSYRAWAERLAQLARSKAVAEESSYWLAEERRQVKPLPVDSKDDAGTQGAERIVEVSLTAEETRALLQDVPRAYRTEINDVLLTALAQTFARWTGESRLLVDLEGHGREEVGGRVDVSRTVGWFTTLFPVVLELDGATEAGSALKSVKEQLRSIPRRGFGYGLLRYMSGEADVQARLRSMPRAQVSFNYLGQYDQMMDAASFVRPAEESAGATRDAQGKRSHLLEVGGNITGGRLRLVWAYSRQAHRRETIERLADAYVESLRSLIAHCQSPEAGGYTPSDFPLAQLSQRQLDRLTAASPEVEDIYPLSPMQQGILFHTLYAPGGEEYFEQMSSHLCARVNVEAFERAWQQAVKRQTVLRTSFVWEGVSEPLQLVHASVPFSLEQRDWRSMSEDEQRESLREFLEGDRARGFDLGSAPLLRLNLIRLGEESYQFVFSYHHILMDGWATSQLLQEVFALYEAFCRGVSPRLEPAAPYSDYIAWLRRQDMQKAEAFWRGELDGLTTPTKLAGKLPSGLADAAPGLDEQRLLIASEASSALHTFAQQNRLTLNTLVQGTWALMLSRYTDERDIVFGATVSGRPAALRGIESRVGLFINTLPVRLRVNPRARLIEWLRELQEKQAELQQYDYSPLVQVQGWSGVPRGVPLFETLLVFESYPVDHSVGASASLGIDDLFTFDQTSYPLTLEVVPGRELFAKITYNRRLFSGEMIQRMLGHFEQTLSEFITNTEQQLSTLSILTHPEREQLLREWNETASDYPHDTSYASLFSAQARLSPNLLALSSSDGSHLTYAQLDELSTRLALRLRSHGIGSESLLALLMPRGIDFVTCILSAFKAGAAYLPLDPQHPPLRLSQVIGDARPQLLITSGGMEEAARHSASLLDSETVEVHTLDQLLRESDVAAPPHEGASHAGEFSAAHADELSSIHSPEQLAYVIYTSGSTGSPKGAMLNSRGLLNHLFAKLRLLELTPSDLVAQSAPQSFDISIWQMLSPLLAGAGCRVLSDEVTHDPAALLREVEESAITILEVVPSMLRAMLEVEPAPALTSLSSLRYLLVTGEALPPELARRWMERYPSVTLVNAYGPTECSDDVTHHILTVSPDEDATRVQIGRAVENTRLYVLDREMGLVPEGVAGELYVGGDGVGRGYLNRSELTAERFVPDPFGGGEGARLYRTGDVVRYVGGGELEFLGRADGQVKVRGQRIELGEVEAVVGGHEGVRTCAVMARGEGERRRLVAYVELMSGGEGVEERGGEEDGVDGRDEAEVGGSREEARVRVVGEVRAYVRERLPEYMTPTQYVVVEEMPLTVAGKVDRRRLEAMGEGEAGEWEGGESEAEYEEPETETEREVAEVFSEVLGVRRVGRGGNFFEMGGHSLLATQVASRLRMRMGVEIALRELFERPTVSQLAELIDSSAEGARDTRLPPIKRVPRDGELPLSYAQQRLWFLNLLAPESAFYTIPVVFRLDGPLNVRALERSIFEVTKRHEVLRTTFPVVSGRPVQKIGPPHLDTIPVIDLSTLDAEERERTALRLATRETRRSFDLARDALMHTCLLRLGEEEHIVVVAVHHIVTDAWSMALMIEEAAALYKAHMNGEPSPLAELPVQYADFAVWQRRWLQGEALEEHLRYWRKQLGGTLPTLDLPGARTRPATQTFCGQRRVVTLPSSLIEAAEELGRREGATLFMILLAAFQTLLHRYSGQDDIIVGSPVSSRPGVETERIVGCFLNLLALRTDLSGDPSFRELLGRVREVTLGAFAHADVPFEKVVEAVQPERAPGRSPIFDVTFSLINTPAARTEMFQGLTLTPLDVETGTSQFDLIALLDEVEQGMNLTLMYNSDLFDAQFIERLTGDFVTLLGSIVRQPDARLNELELVTEAERKERMTQDTQREELKRRKFISVKHRAIDLSQERLVRMGELEGGRRLPLLVEPEVGDVNLAEWMKGNRSLIEAELHRRGGILFRGFDVKSAEEFRLLTTSLCRRMMKYQERSTPRTEVAENIYTSTEYPAEQSIALHNEFSYARVWPMRVWFFCQHPPHSGGQTPIADSRQVLQTISERVRQQFATRGVMYLRNYGAGIDLPWQTVFQTESRQEVEEYCRRAPIGWEWMGDDRLKTWQVRQGVAVHPRTGERVWFNQAHLFHVSNLEREVRESLVSAFGEGGLPRQARYGDGGEIEEEALEEVRRGYRESEVLFDWERGDVLLLDNMLVAHGRRPYSGERKILAALAEPFKAEEPSTSGEPSHADEPSV